MVKITAEADKIVLLKWFMSNDPDENFADAFDNGYPKINKIIWL